ncbi:extracellular solute-binding protein family 1 [Caldicellulosiruptor owensensis OL]|uniref:Extracellular solute-binding protein family 1 n=1 Tax=Caldicellulosiruptor owensensis (strain ATCC 700167 / DSM 13100 / OL) TaxID=632518 RepID=E4Q5W9_CALOW|nr:ABC transporter substrate-binding protein [Caldicellulosiruptor owensensis]ADQ05528.1 extracellular solute-binding protein family 1 [Caldicellulosiruptor owensensis OL]
MKRFIAIVTLIIFCAGLFLAFGLTNSNAASKKQVTITYVRGKDETQATNKILQEFMKKNPDIKVIFKENPSDTGQNHDQLVTVLSAGGSDIDVFDMDVIWPAEFAQAGYTLPLDRFIKRDKINLNDYIKGTIDAARFKGQMWAFPRFIDAGVLYYRKDIVPQNELPKTWDDLIKVAKKYKGKNGTKYGFLMQAKQYEGLVCDAIEYIASYGGRVVDESGNIVVYNQGTIDGLNMMRKVITSGIVPPNINTFTEVETHTAFINGLSVFARNWPYMWAMINSPQSKVKGKVGILPLPKGSKGSAACLGGWMVGINKFSKNPEASWRLLKFLVQKEGQKLMAIYNGNVPVYKPLFNDKDVIKANPLIGDKKFVEAILAAVPRPVSPIYPKISDVMQIELSNIVNGKKDVKTAVLDMDKKLKEVVKISK